MSRCRNDNLWMWLFIAAADQASNASSCNCPAPRSSYSEWEEPRRVPPPPAPKFRAEHLGYLFWGVLAVAWFAWLAFFQPSQATALAPPVVPVASAVAAPEPA